MTASSPSSAAVAGFASVERLPSGTLPTAVAAADFNEDGNPDLAISNGADNTVTVLLGDGAGGFTNPPGLLYMTGSTPVWLTAAKLTSSGHADIVTVDADSQELEIFRGNGNGTFQAPTALDTLGQTPIYVATGDFNKDGNVDIAVGLIVENDMTQTPFAVYLGDGSGGFSSTITNVMPVQGTLNPGQASSLIVADLNQDGYPDITVLYAQQGFSYINQGGSSFTGASVFKPSNGLIGLALSDVDGDGCLDAVETSASGVLTIAKGGCNGTFSPGSVVAEVGDQDPAVIVSDVDGDGIPDIVASAAYLQLGGSAGGFGTPGGYTISVLKGTGGGAFAPPAIYRGAANQFSLVAVELNRSGLPDLVAVAQMDNAVIRLANDGKGNFGAPPGEAIGYLQGIQNAPSPITSPEVVDLNGDGHPDVLLAESGAGTADPAQLTSLLNDGKGKLQPPVRTPISARPNPIYSLFTAAGFRSPQKADAIVIATYSDQKAIEIYPGNGDGSFGSPAIVGSVPYPVLLQSGDVNHDGKMDFVVYGVTYDQTQAEIDVYLGNGDGTFRHVPAQLSAPSVSPLTGQQIFVEDFNHDGKLDLLLGFNGGWSFPGDDLELALGRGDGTFQNPVTVMSHFGPVAIGDVNHDGYPDLVQVHDPGQSITAQALDTEGQRLAPAATIYLGQPGGTFAKGATYLAPQVQTAAFSSALLGDFDGDGNLDIAIPYTTSGPSTFQLLVLAGTGDGAFHPSAIPYRLPLYDVPVVGGDFSGTGRTDLLDLIGATSSINLVSSRSTATVSLSFDALPLPATGGSVTVSLATPAKAGESITLSASDPAVDIPASVTVAAGALQQSVSYTVGPGFDRNHMLAISASRNGYTASVYGSLANANRKAGVQATIGILHPSAQASAGLAAGDSIDLVFNLASQGGYSGNFGNLTCTGLPPGATCTFVAPTLSLPAGGSTDTAFQISTNPNTPMGIYRLHITASNGAITASAALSFGVGTFTISASPATIPINDGAKQPYTTITANYQDGFTADVDVSCTGLPASATCYFGGALYPGTNTAQISLSETGLPAGDYPFTITGKAGSVTRSIPAVMRVESYTASLSQTKLTTVTRTPVTATVTFLSLNHFATGSIQLSCASSANVTCNPTPYNAVLSDGGSATVKLTITGILAPVIAVHKSSTWKRTAAGFSLACLLFPFALAGGRRARLLLSLCVIAVCIGMSACGGGASKTNGGGNGAIPGSQTISVQVNASAFTTGGPINQPVGTISLTLTP
ncbi:MAG TPA: VCBS repeat-containing protein [Acidobacteriaceae bacterium]